MATSHALYTIWVMHELLRDWLAGGALAGEDPAPATGFVSSTKGANVGPFAGLGSDGSFACCVCCSACLAERCFFDEAVVAAHGRLVEAVREAIVGDPVVYAAIVRAETEAKADAESKGPMRNQSRAASRAASRGASRGAATTSAAGDSSRAASRTGAPGSHAFDADGELVGSEWAKVSGSQPESLSGLGAVAGFDTYSFGDGGPDRPLGFAMATLDLLRTQRSDPLADPGAEDPEAEAEHAATVAALLPATIVVPEPAPEEWQKRLAAVDEAIKVGFANGYLQG